jgi:hypothetical protein
MNNSKKIDFFKINIYIVIIEQTSTAQVFEKKKVQQKQDRPSLVMVARSIKKSFTEHALKPSYQKSMPLWNKLRF